MNDEALFHLSGHKNTQNTRYWSIENPYKLHKALLHDEKIGVQCSVSENRIVGPIFFNMTVRLYALLTDDDRMYFASYLSAKSYYTPLASVHRGFTVE